ncbi:MAG: peptidoglycan-binding protein [Hyalangium sp.]|uniref:peptidoglycan-binding protein n=1 Tax=Hyalangium sp. TaxID=2028555 RepID=UPI00389B181C
MSIQSTRQRSAVPSSTPAQNTQPAGGKLPQQADSTPKARSVGFTSQSSFEPAASAPAVDLQRGSTGPAVQQLQDDLVKLGYLTQAQVQTGPGIFGPQTETAVKRFQADHGVPQTGYFGPMTRAAMNQALQGSTGSTPPPSTSGSAEVQQLMSEHPVGSYAGQCSGFAAVAAHIPGFPRADGLGPVNGNQMVDFLTSGGHGYHRVGSPAAGDIFSMNIGQYGHTGVVVGVHDNMVTVLDSNWNLDEKIRVHDIPLSQFSGFARKD